MVKTKYSDQFKAEVMYQRFGSYDKVKRCLVSRGYLAKRFNVKFYTIVNWCRRHKRKPGCLWAKHRYAGRPSRKFYEWQFEAMISKEAMHTQRFMSLRQRIEYLWNEHYIKISYGALRDLYKKAGIKYTKANKMRKSLIRDEKQHSEDRAKVAW